MADESPFFLTGKARHDALTLLRPFKRQGAAHFLGHIAGLVVGEMVGSPEFGRGGNEGL
jgi:hypothetical protein